MVVLLLRLHTPAFHVIQEATRQSLRPCYIPMHDAVTHHAPHAARPTPSRPRRPRPSTDAVVACAAPCGGSGRFTSTSAPPQRKPRAPRCGRRARGIPARAARQERAWTHGGAARRFGLPEDFRAAIAELRVTFNAQ
jgi:hypothetical protein